MPNHKVYFSLIKAVKDGKLEGPFGKVEFKKHCPGLGNGTYQAFLHKHRKGNPGGNTELFELLDNGKFRLIKPLKYQ